DVRSTAEPTAATSFAPHDRIAIRITGLADRCPASGRNTTNFTARQRNLGPTGLTGHQRSASSGTAAKATTATSRKLNVVNGGSQWNLRQRQAVAQGRRRFVATHHH